MDFDKSHSRDEAQLPNFSSNVPCGPLTFQGGLVTVLMVTQLIVQSHKISLSTTLGTTTIHSAINLSFSLSPGTLGNDIFCFSIAQHLYICWCFHTGWAGAQPSYAPSLCVTSS